MSFIQLISNNKESAQFQVNFGNMINIKPNSQVALIDVGLNKTTDINATIPAVATFLISYGATEQGGTTRTYTLLSSAFTTPSSVSPKDYMKELVDTIKDADGLGSFNSYTFYFTPYGISQGMTTRLETTKSSFNSVIEDNQTQMWDDGIASPEGWQRLGGSDDYTYQEADLGEGEPNGDFTKNTLIGEYALCHNGGVVMAGDIEGNVVMGLSWDDTLTGDVFTDNYFSSGKSEFWDFDKTIFTDYDTGTKYQFDKTTDLDNYNIKNLSTLAVIGTMEVDTGNPVTPAGAELIFTIAPAIAKNLKFGVGNNEATVLLIEQDGEGYVAGVEYETMDVVGSGQGLIVRVMTVGGSGNVITWEISNRGQGYTESSVIELEGGAFEHPCIFDVDSVFRYEIQTDGYSSLTGILKWERESGSSNNRPEFIEGLPDLPFGILITNHNKDNDDEEERYFSYTIFKHEEGTAYKPFDIDNIQILDSGQVPASQVRDPTFLISVSLNQTVRVVIEASIETDEIGRGIWGDDAIEVGKWILEDDTLPPFAQLRPVFLSDQFGSKFRCLQYQTPEGDEGSNIYLGKGYLTWTGDETDNNFDKKEWLEVSFDWGSSRIDQKLGFEKELTASSGIYPYMDSVGINTISSSGEGSRLNICIDNLTHNSYKNFSNDGAIFPPRTRLFRSGTLDKLVGVFPPEVLGRNTGQLYYQPNPVYLDLNNEGEIQLNSVNVSIRESETNKIATGLYGSTSVTLHIRQK